MDVVFLGADIKDRFFPNTDAAGQDRSRSTASRSR